MDVFKFLDIEEAQVLGADCLDPLHYSVRRIHCSNLSGVKNRNTKRAPEATARFARVSRVDNSFRRRGAGIETGSKNRESIDFAELTKL